MEERFADALAQVDTFEQKATEGMKMLEQMLTDFEARAYSLRDSSLGSLHSYSCYELLDEGRRKVDEGFGRAREAVDGGLAKARRAAERLEEAVERALDKARQQRLLAYTDLPDPWRINGYIKHGYRFNDSLAACLHSTYSHISNETFNIWSHVVGLVLVIALAFHFYPSSPHFSLATRTDVLVAGLFFGAAAKCLICSTLWHTFNSISQKHLIERFACVDYTGISVLIAASIMTTEYTAFYCEPQWAAVWLTTTAVFGIAGTMLPWNPTFNRSDLSWLRVCFYICLAATGFLPAMHISFTR